MRGFIGRKHTEETKKKISLSKKGQRHFDSDETKKKKSISAKKVIHKSTQGFQKGHKLLGNNPTSKGKNWKLSDSTKNKMSSSAIGNKKCLGKKNAFGYKWTKEQIENKIKTAARGSKHWKWIKDRTKLKDSGEINEIRRSSRYKDWSKNIRNRDKHKCRLSNNECLGRLEIHHIFSFTYYPELRYLLTNGITLCHFHHPRKMEEEKRLAPLFQELVSVSEE